MKKSKLFEINSLLFELIQYYLKLIHYYLKLIHYYLKLILRFEINAKIFENFQTLKIMFFY